MYEATATWAEVNFYVAVVTITLISLGIRFLRNKRDGDKYVDWIRDDEPYRR